MCASYGALESTLVSTRSNVPGTFFSAAARTFDATSPVSAFSVLPLTVCACGAVDDEDEDAVEDVAAFAIAPPPSAAAPTAATVTSLVRILRMLVLLASID